MRVESGVLAPALPDPSPSRAVTDRWRDLRLRTLSAAVLAPLALGCLWFGGWAWQALILLAVLGMGLEWAALCRVSAVTWPGALVPALLVLAGVLAAMQHFGAALVLLVLGAGVTWWQAGAWLGFGVPYAGIGALALIWLRDQPGGFAAVLGVLLVVWASDIGAYLIGRLVGGPKLAPAISPGKTCSGALGGLACAMAVGAAFGAPGHGMAIAAVLSVASQLGDLAESALKRRFGVKDSGRSIPGHGGLFDRLDGVLTAAPTAVVLMWLAQYKDGWWQ